MLALSALSSRHSIENLPIQLLRQYNILLGFIINTLLNNPVLFLISPIKILNALDSRNGSEYLFGKIFSLVSLKKIELIFYKEIDSF